MNTSLRAEAKLLRDNWIFLLFLLVLTTGFVIMNGRSAIEMAIRMTPHDGMAASFAGEIPISVRLVLRDGMFTQWIGGILAAYFIGQGFETRSISRLVSRGLGRLSVFGTKCIWFYGTGLLLSICMALGALSFTDPEWFQICPARILILILCRGLCDLANLSLPFCLSFLCRDLIRTVAFPMALTLILFAIVNGDLQGDGLLFDLLTKHPVLQLQSIAMQPVSLTELMQYMLSCLSLTMPFVFVAYLLFRHTELK